MGWPEDGIAVIKSFTGKNDRPMDHWYNVLNIEHIELLGFNGKFDFEQNREGLVITGFPSKRLVEYAHCFRITHK